jgi:general secretion pathway protein L
MAASLVPDRFRLFGIDLAAVAGYLRDGWAEALQWPVFRWLTPSDVVRVLHCDGSESFRQGLSARRVDGQTKAEFVAVVLAEDVVLRRSLSLPRLPAAEIQQAAALDARAASPFAEADLAWGLAVDQRERERIRVDIALTSRKMVDAQCEAHRERLAGVVPEVWADGDRPIVMPGYGEERRYTQERKARRTLIFLIALASMLAGALALTPTLQQRQRAIEASAGYNDLLRKVRPQAQVRDELAKVGEQLRLLRAATKNRQDVLALLDEVTRRLPDDVVLSRFELSSNTVRLSGQSDNAAQLLQTLGAQSDFRDVRAPSGIARAQAGGKESFTIEFNIGAGVKSP